MTTTGAPKTPATPYDKRINDPHFRDRQKMRERREGWLARDADLAPLHRQTVEALEALTGAVEDYISAGAEDLRGWRDDLLKETHAALDAARKAGW